MLPLQDAGSWSASDFDRLEEALDTEYLPAIPFCLDRITANGDHAELSSTARMREAKAFRRTLIRILASYGIVLVAGTLRPHVTLDYRTTLRCDLKIEPIAWMADEILLIESVMGPAGHIIRGRWPLVRPML